MKFKFIGKKSLLNNFVTNKIYNIIQFEIKKRHLCIYIIDENNQLKIISYICVDKFNENWSYIDND